MKYSSVYLEAMGYELAPVVVTSGELEERVASMYGKLRIAPGQLEALTGIVERRWWEVGYPLSAGAAAAAKKALAKSGVRKEDLGVVVYCGVCRENFEPATACAVAAELGISGDTLIYDLSNACLGVMNACMDVANRIELGQIKAGLIVSCESAREINETMIARMNAEPTMAMFTTSLATLTGGSGAVALVLAHRSLVKGEGRKLLGGVAHAEPAHHKLCRWGLAGNGVGGVEPFMTTDAVGVMKHGVELGLRTWRDLLQTMGWSASDVDRVICHQVGSGHRTTILKQIEISPEKDFSTFSYLGNMGTVSLPLTAALAEQRGVLKSGQKAAFLGIGSGLNCLMLGWEW